MSIFPLPVFEADADPRHRNAMTDEEIYERLEPPKTIVVRFGYMKLIGEFAYDGAAKPGCGSKLVARTHRGTEVVEMLTTTCDNAGCAKSVSRQEMLEYIGNSGGRDFPFHTNGRVLRVATIDDLNRQSELDGQKQEQVKACKQIIAETNLPMKLVEVEPILGGELLTFYYMSEERVDFRELVRELAARFKARIEMRQVGARDEARLVADYERCGQHCCCKNFLKVLKPVSMRSAKVQKATLDPLKISGRCGRLMCCLRYEDQTYKQLRQNLPARGKRVGTSEGPGVVVDSKILVQLVLVRLEHDGKEVAVPVEELMDPETCPKPGETAPVEPEWEPDPLRGLSAEQVAARTDVEKREKSKRSRRRSKDRKTKHEQQDDFRTRSQAEPAEPAAATDGGVVDGDPKAVPRGPRRRRRGAKGRRKGNASSTTPAEAQPSSSTTPPPDGSPLKQHRSRRQRGGRRRRPGGTSPE
jgi:cell fate regulator YaaT (PSP1 superfamily)